MGLMIEPGEAIVPAIQEPQSDSYIGSSESYEVPDIGILTRPLEIVPTQYVDLRDYYVGSGTLPECGKVGETLNAWLHNIRSKATNSDQTTAINNWRREQKGTIGINSIYAGSLLICTLGVENPFRKFRLPCYGEFGYIVNPPNKTIRNIHTLLDVFGMYITKETKKPLSRTYLLKYK